MFDVRIDKNFICYVGAGDTNGLTVSYSVQASINVVEELMLCILTCFGCAQFFWPFQNILFIFDVFE